MSFARDMPNYIISLITDIISTSSNKNSKTIFGVQVAIDTKCFGFTWAGAAGHTSKEMGSQCHAEDTFRIASNTKTFVGAAVLRLYEKGLIDLDCGIEKYICCEHANILRSGGYQLNEISIRQLLSHTSGLYDYADSKEFENIFLKNPKYQWTRTDQLALAIEIGQSYGPPGTVYRYSDTGYILLGEIVESVTNKSLGLALRDLLSYEKLGLKSTWLEQTESPPKNIRSRVHQYLGEIDLYHMNPSYDIFGGGGLVSNVGDIARFYRALFDNNLFDKKSTLNLMLSPIPAERGGPNAYDAFVQVPGVYRLGISGNHENTFFHHGGYLGSIAGYSADTDSVVCLSLNQNQAHTEKEFLLHEIFRKIREFQSNSPKHSDSKNSLYEK